MKIVEKPPERSQILQRMRHKIATAQPMNAEAERPAVNTAAPPINKPPVRGAPPPPQQTYAPPGPYMPADLYAACFLFPQQEASRYALSST